MADRRRRSARVSGDSEEFSEGSEDVEQIKASEGDSEQDAETETTGPRGESEYESADSDDERGSKEKLQKSQADHGSDHEDGSHGNEDEEEEEICEDEEEDELMYGTKREEGDGEESIPSKEKKLDDDEDRRNPQYIPKRGTFYEHDDRTAEEQEQGEEPKKEEPRKKKVWKENEDRWSHDKFNEMDQAPKSRDELVASYGYDIRSEEGPPRARRRRRYGRGPNKYDRNWEDENAYSKPSRGGGRGGGGGKDGPGRLRRLPSGDQDDLEVNDDEEFPALSSVATRRGGFRGRGGRGKNYREFESTHRQQQHAANKSASTAANSNLEMTALGEKSPPPPLISPPAPTNQPTRGGRGRGVKPTRTGGSGRIVEVRGRNRGGGQMPVERGEKKIFRGPRIEGQMEEREIEISLEDDVKNMSINDQEPPVSRDFRRSGPKKVSPPYHQQTERRQPNVPPRMQQQENAANRPKRYSSQRQRSLPETSASAYEQQSSGGAYYEQGYQPHAVYTETPQPASTVQPQPSHPPAVPVSTAQPSVTPQPILAPPTAGPPTFAPNYPSPPPTTFIPHVQPTPQPPRMFTPAQPAPTFMAPSAPMINFVPTPPTQFAPTFPPFQSYPPVPQPPPAQPAEMFVPSSGITYYSPQNQVPRHTPLKRPKAAIPILPPPPSEKAGAKTGSSTSNTGQDPSSGQSQDSSSPINTVEDCGTHLENSDTSQPDEIKPSQIPYEGKGVSIPLTSSDNSDEKPVMPIEKITDLAVEPGIQSVLEVKSVNDSISSTPAEIKQVAQAAKEVPELNSPGESPLVSEKEEPAVSENNKSEERSEPIPPEVTA